MRILHVIPTYVPAWRHGGPVRSVHGLARTLVRLGHEVEVLTTNVNGDEVLDVPLGERVDVDGVGVSYYPVWLSQRMGLAPAIKVALPAAVASADIVHVHALFQWLPAAAAAAACKAARPCVVSPRGMLDPALIRRRGALRKRVWFALSGRRMLARAAALHATTEMEAGLARATGLTLPPIVIVPNGVDDPTASSLTANGLTDPVREAIARGPFALFLGRLSWKKGLDRLVPALVRCPGVNLIAAGNDDERLTPRLQALGREVGVAERLHFVGEVHGEDKAALLAGAAALVLPSYGENFAMVVAEAMAAGCPVVVTPEVGLAPLVASSGAGVVTDGDPEALGSILAALIDDPERRGEMGARGRAAARERLAWDVVATRMVEVYQAVLAGALREDPERFARWA